MHVLLVQNSPTSGPGRLPAWLEQEGLEVTVVLGEDLPADLSGVDGIVLLGGGFMPDDDERAPWLAHERALAGQALDQQLPLWGICLGEQLLALIAGGRVTEDSGETERGSCGIDLLPAAEQDPMFSAVAGEQLRMIQNHEDSVTWLPPEVTLLGTSPECRIQAFRVGPVAWGIQFHPEVGADRLWQWDEAGLAAQGLDRNALVAAAQAEGEVNERQSRALVAGFAAVVRERGGAR